MPAKKRSRSSKPVKMTPEALAHLAVVFRVLGDGARLQLLQELKEGEQTVGELVDLTGMGQTVVSKHLKMMHQAALLSRRKEGTRVIYAVSDPTVFKLCELVCGKLNREREEAQGIEYMI
ncbi:MAG: ArsR/SmtB family transcription factor [Akkermansiaceae bacterium]